MVSDYGAPGAYEKFSGTGTNDNDTVIEIENALLYDTFTLFSTAGAMDVSVTLDGSNWSSPLSLSDLGAASTTPVLVTAAGRIYGFAGPYKGVRVLQNGAIAVANAALVCKRTAR